MFNLKKSLFISAISCMSLYAAEIKQHITIGESTKDNKVAEDLENNTDYNYWLDSNTYVFNRDKDKHNTRWIANNTVTIDNGYTLKLITNYTDGYYFVLDCYNKFTNNGNVIIDKYGTLGLNKTSINNGTIDINKGILGLWRSAILTNTGTITLKGSSFIYIDNSAILNNTNTITFKVISFIDIYYSGTLKNTGTIDISNITDLSNWINKGTFTLEEGSTFILPKSIPTNKIGDLYGYTFNITLNGTKDKHVNIVIPKGCEYITDKNKTTDELFDAIYEATGLTFDGNINNVNFIIQEEDAEQQ